MPPTPVHQHGPACRHHHRQDRTPGSPPCLRFDDLTLGYGAHPAVHGLCGTLDHGSLLALIGPNGSGKSTLLKGIAGLLKPMSGSLVHADGCAMAYLPQMSDIDRSFPASVRDLVKLGLWRRRGLLGRFSTDDQLAVSNALKAVGLEGFDGRSLDTLSGGQLQRALFARLIVQDADLILLDEPFNAIDTRTVDDLMALVSAWHQEGRTVIAVMHDLGMVRARFPQALLLSREAMAWGPTGEVLLPENLARARRFHAAWDEDAAWCGDHHQVHDHGAPAPASSGTEKAA